MPHTLPPPIVEAQAVHPVTTSGDKPVYTTGDSIPASHSEDNSPAPTPSSARSRSRTRDPFFQRPSRDQSRDPSYQREQQLGHTMDQVHLAQAAARAGSQDRERSRSRAASRDPFFRRETSTDPHHQGDLQHQVIMDQVRHAQEGKYAADLERALRASRTESRSTIAGDGSKSRSTSHIRSAIKAIVNDPFFHRAGKDEDQAAELHKIILSEVAAAKASSAAGEVDRAKREGSSSRSRSRARGEDGARSQPGSRSQSRVRSAVSNLLRRDSAADIKEEAVVE